MRESVYFNKEWSVGQLFGFHQKVLEPHSTKTYRSDQTVNILRINTICLEYNTISGSYVDNTPNHTLHEFGINVPPGYKMTVTPHNLIYLPINCDEMHTIYTDSWSKRLFGEFAWWKRFDSHAHSVNRMIT